MTTHVTLKIEFDSLLDAALVEEFIRDKQLPCKIRVARTELEPPRNAAPLIKARRTRQTITPAMVKAIIKERGRMTTQTAAAHFGLSTSSVDRIFSGTHVLQKNGQAPA